MKSIYDIIPDHEVILSLEPEEIGGVILEFLNEADSSNSKGLLNRYNFSQLDTVREYPRSFWNDIQQVLLEGWMWLEKEGMIAYKPDESGNWIFITRRGKKLKNREGLGVYRASQLLPVELIHPQILSKIKFSFIRGEYDVAVFSAFKELEIYTREKCSYPADNDHLGEKLMRKAFRTTDGPLSDLTSDLGERQAVQNLFAGALGSYKSPHSHKHIVISDPKEAIEMIIIASHLLNIVEAKQIN